MCAEIQAPGKKHDTTAFSLPDAYQDPSIIKLLKQAFAQQRYVSLPQLFTGKALRKLKSEFRRLERFAEQRNFTMPGYETARMMTTIGGRIIRQKSTFLSQLYSNQDLRTLLAQVAQAPLFDCHDENEWAVGTVLRALGNTHGWHLDDPPLALVIFLESPPPDKGGMVEFISDWPRLCVEIGVDPQKLVEPTVDMCRTVGLVHSRHHSAGDAYVLHAGESLHRVMPLTAAGARRAILNFAFELEPEVKRESVTAKLLFEG